MKKLIIASFVFAMLLVSQNVNASSLWNGASNDCPGISIANQTTNNGIVVPCWPLKTVSGNSGDSINIRFYYHNTSTSNATNVKFLLTAPTGASSSHTFSGQIVSDQGNLSLGSVSVNTPTGSTLKFSSAHWLPNQRQVESAIPFGQSSNGSEILGGGLNIGTVAPGWDTQGSVVVAFSVNAPVNPPAGTPTGTLTASNTSCSIPANASSCDINFSWNTTNPVGTSAVTRDGGPTVATGNSGSKAFTIPYLASGNSTFRLYNNGLELDTESVSSYCTSGTSWNGSVCSANVNPNYSCSITNFTVGGALSTTVTSGNSVELAWTTTGCNYVNITDVGSNLPVNSSYTVYPTSSRTYTITGYGSNGANPTRTVTVTVNQSSNPTYACSISSFTADGSSYRTVSNGDSVELYWNTNNCNNISITSVGYNLGSSGRYDVSPSRNTRYTLTARGLIGGVQTRYVDINVSQNNYPNTNYTCSINNFSASNTYVAQGGSTTLNWNTSNCSSVSISTLGNVYSSGSRTVYPNGNTNYVLTAYGNYGSSQTRYVYINTDSYVPPTPVYNKCAVTTLATNVNQTGAQLNGIVTSGNGANTYFEYGTTVNLGYRTNSRYANANTPFTEIVSGLSPNTIYYFRMVSDCAGISQGTIEVFRTSAVQVPGDNTIIKTVYVQGKTVVGDQSPVLLKISNRYQMIGAGDLVDYVVNYKNIGKVTLNRPMVQVVLPTNITLVNSSRGTYAVDTHTLSAQIEDLKAGEEGVIFLQGRVDSIPLNNSQIPTTAILIYTSSTGSQENAMAYVINTPKVVGVTGVVEGDQTSVLGGSAFFGGLLSLGLVGWLIIILIILIIILIVRSAYGRNTGGGAPHAPTH